MNRLHPVSTDINNRERAHEQSNRRAAVLLSCHATLDDPDAPPCGLTVTVRRVVDAVTLVQVSA